MGIITYATGKYSKAICDRCGAKYFHCELILENETNLRVCQECLDVIPQNPKWKGPTDRIPLRWARPELPVCGDEEE